MLSYINYIMGAMSINPLAKAAANASGCLVSRQDTMARAVADARGGTHAAEPTRSPCL